VKDLDANDPLVSRARNAIPTHYAGVQFRSRLEAKWAAMFDLLEWDWEYEPFDLDFYVPDFVLKFHRPILVEVKPWLKTDDARAVQAALDLQPWDGEILIAGSQIGNFAPDTACGLLRDSEGGWGDAILSHCVECDTPMLRSGDFSWRCRTCGFEDGHKHLIALQYAHVSQLWREAGNLSQWRAPA
jgi:hypothetical protein